MHARRQMAAARAALAWARRLPLEGAAARRLRRQPQWGLRSRAASGAPPPPLHPSGPRRPLSATPLSEAVGKAGVGDRDGAGRAAMALMGRGALRQGPEGACAAGPAGSAGELPRDAPDGQAASLKAELHEAFRARDYRRAIDLFCGAEADALRDDRLLRLTLMTCAAAAKASYPSRQEWWALPAEERARRAEEASDAARAGVRLVLLVARDAFLPEVSTLNVAMDACGSAGLLRLALSLSDAMRRDLGIRPSASTYHTLLRACARVPGGGSARWREAMALLDKMARDAQVNVTHAAFTLCLEALAKAGRAAEGLELAKRMAQEEVPVSGHDYLLLLSSVAAAGEASAALELLSAMPPALRRAPHTLAAMEACAAASPPRAQDAEHLFASLEADGAAADAAQLSLIKCGAADASFRCLSRGYAAPAALAAARAFAAAEDLERCYALACAVSRGALQPGTGLRLPPPRESLCAADRATVYEALLLTAWRRKGVRAGDWGIGLGARGGGGGIPHGGMGTPRALAYPFGADRARKGDRSIAVSSVCDALRRDLLSDGAPAEALRLDGAFLRACGEEGRWALALERLDGLAGAADAKMCNDALFALGRDRGGAPRLRLARQGAALLDGMRAGRLGLPPPDDTTFLRCLFGCLRAADADGAERVLRAMAEDWLQDPARPRPRAEHFRLALEACGRARPVRWRRTLQTIEPLRMRVRVERTAELTDALVATLWSAQRPREALRELGRAIREDAARAAAAPPPADAADELEEELARSLSGVVAERDPAWRDLVPRAEAGASGPGGAAPVLVHDGGARLRVDATRSAAGTTCAAVLWALLCGAERVAVTLRIEHEHAAMALLDALEASWGVSDARDGRVTLTVERVPQARVQAWLKDQAERRAAQNRSDDAAAAKRKRKRRRAGAAGSGAPALLAKLAAEEGGGRGAAK